MSSSADLKLLNSFRSLFNNDLLSAEIGEPWAVDHEQCTCL